MQTISPPAARPPDDRPPGLPHLIAPRLANTVVTTVFGGLCLVALSNIME